MAGKIKSLFKHIEHIGTPEALPPSQNVPPAPQFEPFDNVKAEIFRHRKQVGVNLGCVFCLEGWLAPQSLKSTGNWESEVEYLESCKSRECARDLLEQHWKTHITEKDFEFLASTGINAVRLPIGYWVAADRDDLAGPFKKYRGVYDAAWNYFLITIQNAAKHNIGVLVDLHGAPGGQNYDSHSGTSGKNPQLFKLGSHNQSLTLKILKKLATTLAPINNVIGLEVLNEPQDDSSLGSFYQEAIKTIRGASSNASLPIYIGDAWNVEKYSEFIAKHQDQFDFCVLDTHQYFCHMPADHAKTAEQHTKHLQTGLKDKLISASRRIRGSLVVGEWAVVLNNKSIPQGRHDGDVMREFGQAQLAVYDQACAGQFYWTYKTADDKWYWSYIYCHNNRILPQNMGGYVQGDPQSLTGQQDGAAEAAKQEHLSYWQQQKNGQAVVDNAWRFEEGFKTGYQVALRFLQLQSRVGFAGQLAHEYAMQHLAQSQQDKDAAKANIWQFEHGFMQAVVAVNQQLK